MPELPEVEHVARTLDRAVRGRRIVRAELLRERLAPFSTASEFAASLAPCTILSVGRRGKHILFELDNGSTLMVHLRMSGRFSLLAMDEELPKFTHAAFSLDKAQRLVFDDQRHFGFMKVAATQRLLEEKELAKLAPEPFSKEFTPAYLHTMAKRCSQPLKNFLLDQTKVCGLGNIYAAEALFAAGLDPRKRSSALTRPKAERLHASIIAVLAAAIDHADASGHIDVGDAENAYFNGGSDGGWSVYDREHQPCLKCSAEIIRLKQGGRSTYYCRVCQKR